jgi:hypothetical protein
LELKYDSLAKTRGEDQADPYIIYSTSGPLEMQLSSSSDVLSSKKYRLGGPQLDRDAKWILSDNELLRPPQQREDLDFDRNSEKKVPQIADN